VNDALAVVAAVVAAVTFACANVQQQKAAATAPESESLKPSLIVRLLHRRSWLLGILGMIVAYGMQAVALALSDVALVEPIIATELVFAVPLSMRVRHCRPGMQEWAGVLLVAGGVTTFLVAADPSGGHADAGPAAWLLALLPSVGAIAALLLLAQGPQTRARAMLLGGAAGIANGMVALLTKSFTAQLGHSVLGAVASWQLYALCAFAAAGFLFAQSAYQAAPLAESLPVMDSLEPLSSVVLAAAVIGEYVDLSPLHMGVELAAAVVVLAGVVLLGRSPVALSIFEQQQRTRELDRRQPGSDELAACRDTGRRGYLEARVGGIEAEEAEQSA
jgi:drug/metabolite transporter (DMT)-like permease